jgi:protein SCO1
MTRVPCPARLTALAALAGAAAMAGGCGGGSSSPATVPVQGPAALGALPAKLQNTPAPQMRLTDVHSGTTATVALDTSSLRGTPYFVTFLYTHCTTTCPVIGDELRETLQRLGPLARRVAVVGVSVQPGGDTPSTVRHWLAVHHEPANFHYLIGTTAQLTPVWKAWFTSPQTSGGESDHTAAVWIVDAHGRRVAEVPAGAAIDPGQLAAEARRLL